MQVTIKAKLKIFDFLCSRGLDLYPMTFTYELILWRYTGCAKMNFARQGFRKLSYYSLKMRVYNYAWSLPVT